MKRLKKRLSVCLLIVESETSARLEDCTKNVILKPDQISLEDSYHSAKITETFVFSSIKEENETKNTRVHRADRLRHNWLVCCKKKIIKRIKNRSKPAEITRAQRTIFFFCGSSLIRNETENLERERARD